MMDDMKNLMRYGLGEHEKGKEITYNEGLMNKNVAVKWDYYDRCRPVRLIDKRTGEVVNSGTWW